MFASFSRYKREAFRHSQFAPKILNDADIPVIMKVSRAMYKYPNRTPNFLQSDHSGIVSRWLLHEAQQAHHYGLPEAVALSSVISTPARTLGLDHRIGFIKIGELFVRVTFRHKLMQDSRVRRWLVERDLCPHSLVVTLPLDIVLWDSHPLTLGATPRQVFIDGIAQFVRPYTLSKSVSPLMAPKTPNFENEAKAAVEHEGLPPLGPKESSSQTILFTNLTSVWIRKGNKVHSVFSDLISPTDRAERGVVGVKAGNIVCVTAKDCEQFKPLVDKIVDLEGGAIQPGLTTYGSDLGVQEISMEKSTVDGPVFDPLTHIIPKILGEEALIRAVDGLQYQTRNSLSVHLQKPPLISDLDYWIGWLTALESLRASLLPIMQVDSCLVSASSSRPVRFTNSNLAP